jgi:hypothetical protein
MNGRLFVGLVSIVCLSGCGKLVSMLNKEEIDASAVVAETPDAAPVVTATATTPPAASSAPPVVKAAATTTSSGKKALVASPTTDRVQRNRDKDGPCPAGFAEQPGVENHSVCARTCKTETDCHGHTCEDSDVGGKVCSEIASKKTATKCKANEIEDGKDCLKQCSADKDCGKGKCEQMKVPNPFGGTSTAMVCR